jgi:DNA-binding response OmpR family regulator
VNSLPPLVIVDDEPSIRRLLVYALERAGYTCVTASDGDEGLQRIREHQPRLVILDVMLPRRSGYEICRQIRQDPALAGTQVLMLSAKGHDLDRERGLEAGADAYLTKPFRVRELLDQVTALLGRGT